MTNVHLSGEITLGALLSIATMLLSAGGFFIWIGQLQTLLKNVIKDAEQVRNDLVIHSRDDQTTFRQIEATLNQIVGQLHMVGQLQVQITRKTE